MQGQSAFTDAASAARICPDCGVSYKRRNGRRCDTCAHTNYLYRAYGSGRELAIAAVLKARIAGALPSISTCTCVDCGAQAEHYEHRDYNQPLDVVPTCRSCNRRRGNAIPKSWSFDEFWAYYNTLSVSKREPFLSLTQDDFAPIRRKYFDAARAA